MKELLSDLKFFVEERDWAQFHSPKNLAIALSVEVSEILEHFQWLTNKDSHDLPPEKLEEVKQEIGDAMIYLMMLSDKLGINPIEEAKKKLEINQKKYPDEKVRGNSAKYSEYDDE